MAIRAFAVLIEASGNSARYDCGIEEGGPERGILSLRFDPELVVEWEDGRPLDLMGRNIAGRAGRLFRQSGNWPDNASIQS